LVACVAQRKNSIYDTSVGGGFLNVFQKSEIIKITLTTIIRKNLYAPIFFYNKIGTA
jgi:hypothetical protein